MTPLRRPAEAEPFLFEEPAAEIATPDRVISAPTLDARSLQARAEAWAISRTLDQTADREIKWSARRSMAFMVGATMVLWSAIFVAGWLVAKSL